MNYEFQQALKKARLALEGDSNDAEHDALNRLVEAADACGFDNCTESRVNIMLEELIRALEELRL